MIANSDRADDMPELLLLATKNAEKNIDNYL